MESSIKHLVVAVGGIGLCFASQIVGNWYIPVKEGSQTDAITIPFVIASIIMVIIGILCCLGAMLCEAGRYDKKK